MVTNFLLTLAPTLPRPSAADLQNAVLTQVSIYWFSLAGLAASVRIYYELSKTSQSGSFFPQNVRPCRDVVLS